MSDLSVGNISTSGTRNRISGTSSGLDTESLIKNAVQANNQKADRIDVRIDGNQSKIDSLDEYYGLSQALQDSLKSLKSVTSRLGEQENAFTKRTGTLSSDGTDPAGLILPTIEGTAAPGQYEITVLQKAEPLTVQTQTVLSRTADLNYTGAFEIGLIGKTPATINITADLSLEEIASAINNTTTTTGVSASILRISETSYRLVLKGTETNVNIDVTTLSGTVLSDLGLTDGSDNFLPAQITQAAQGSTILFGSTQISRDTNTYDDLIEGVKFDVRGVDATTKVTLTIANDISSAKDAIIDFMEAYNALRDFFALNQTVNADGTVPEGAVLFSDNIVEDLSFGLSNILTSRTGSDDSVVKSLRDLGIQLDNNNKLIVDDETKLDDALLNNFDDVENFFSTQATISNSQLGIITNTSTARALDFTINVTIAGDGSISSAVVNGAEGGFQIEGTRLIGRKGSVFEGLTFAYIGTTSSSISVSLRAGLADQVFNSIEPYTNASDGIIQARIDFLRGTNEDLEGDAKVIRDRGEVIREQQIQKYSKMEAQLERAKGLLAQIKAILGGGSED